MSDRDDIEHKKAETVESKSETVENKSETAEDKSENANSEQVTKDAQEIKMDIIAEENLRSSKMRTMPVGKLLATMSIPAILSMLIQALYNVVDSVFVSFHSGQDGITALSLAMPMQLLLVAFGVGIGVGTNAQIAKALGEGNRQKANKLAQNGVFLALIMSAIFVVAGLLFSGPFIGLFAKSEAVRQMGTTYLTICISMGFGSIMELTCSKIMQSTGNMKIPMISQLIGAITNLILDPILIFGVGFIPSMGVMGAAVATIVGQIFSMTFVIIMFLVGKHDVSISPKGFRPERKLIFAICKIGFPVMVMNAVASITTTAMNAIINKFDDAVSILGVYFKMQSFVFMPVFGLTQGLMPILAYNYGAKIKKRFMSAFKTALVCALIIMTAGFFLFQFGSPLMLKYMFNASGQFLSNGIVALRIISYCFIPAAFGIVMTTVIQSVGKGYQSLILSLMRQLVLSLPMAAIFAIFNVMDIVWLCYPISEFVVFAIFLPYTILAVRKAFKAFENPTPLNVSKNALN